MEEKKEQLQLFKVRDLRQKTQFKIDDVYLNGYARKCGTNATLVYISLCRHAEFYSQKAFPSQKKIAWEHNVSTRTVKRGLKELIKYNIVAIEQEKMGGKFANNIYVLLDKSEWKKSTEGQRRHTAHRGTETEGQKPRDSRVPYKDNKEIRITNNNNTKESNKERDKRSLLRKDISPSVLKELKEKVNQPAPRPLVNQVFSYFQKQIQEEMGFTPYVNWGKDNKVAKLALKRFDFEKVKKIIDWYIQSKKFDEYGASIGVALSVDTINKYLYDNEREV